MSSPDETRNPPEVIRVPPPPATPLPFVLVFAIGAQVAFLGILLTVGEGGWTWGSVVWVAAGTIGPFVVTAWNRRRCGRHNTMRTRILEELRDSTDGNKVIAIGNEWARVYPRVSDLEPALAKLPPPDPPAARVVCLGLADIPKVNDYHCEPQIIAPWGFVSRRVSRCLLVFGVLFFISLLCAAGPFQLPCFFGPALFAVLFCLTWGGWFLKVFFRPTFVRFAPGIIEFLNFRFRGGRAIVRRYPMEIGTRVIITDRRRSFEVELTRGKHTDSFSCRARRGSEAVLDRLLRAMLSTAPIPTMSEEELIG